MSLSTTILDLLFPPHCVHCHREGQWLCPQAQQQLADEQPFTVPVAAPITAAVVRGSYDCRTIGQLIIQLKYHGWFGLTSTLTDLWQPVLPLLPAGPWAIVPVPLHSRRQRDRGFNQADILARSLSQLTGWPVRRVLTRHRYTSAQAQLGEAARQTNITGAFRLATRVDTFPKYAMLIDDVLTTGATLTECATILQQAGVEHISAAALAKG